MKSGYQQLCHFFWLNGHHSPFGFGVDKLPRLGCLNSMSCINGTFSVGMGGGQTFIKICQWLNS